MPNALFELDRYGELPLWAQVLLASRLVRRAVQRLSDEVPAKTRDLLTAGCDALDRSAEGGGVSRADRATLEQAGHLEPTSSNVAISSSMYYAMDCAIAAEASNDFSAAESACTASAGQAMAWASEADGMTVLQAKIFAAADLDLLRFACGEARVGRYDGLPREVLLRMTPVHPLSAAERAVFGSTKDTARGHR